MSLNLSSIQDSLDREREEVYSRAERYVSEGDSYQSSLLRSVIELLTSVEAADRDGSANAQETFAGLMLGSATIDVMRKNRQRRYPFLARVTLKMQSMVLRNAASVLVDGKAEQARGLLARTISRLTEIHLACKNAGKF